MTTRVGRRPIAHVEQLRSKAYEVRATLSRKLNRAQSNMRTEDWEVIKTKTIHAYLTSLLEYQANLDVVVVLDWLQGEGLNDARYRRYFTEHEDMEIFEPTDVPQSEEIRRTVVRIDALRRDEKYDLYNLTNRNYTEDTVDHWLKKHWKVLESSQGSEDAFHVIYIDLCQAIEGLSDSERKVVRYVCEGWSLKDIDKLKGIPTARKLYTIAKKNIVLALNGDDSAKN